MEKDAVCRQLPTHYLRAADTFLQRKKSQIAFGKTLKALRTEKGLTQQQLADFAGLDRAYISELERGILMPSLETVFRLAKELKIKAGDFVELVEKEI